jgi:hypothetical protein
MLRNVGERLRSRGVALVDRARSAIGDVLDGERMREMKVLVCGGRDFNNTLAVFGALDRAHAKHGITLVIHGACPTGADSLAEKWAKSREIPYLGHPAPWKLRGKGAGPMRNQAMLDLYAPEGLIAFPGGDGTADMIRRAKTAGLAVWEPRNSQ